MRPTPPWMIHLLLYVGTGAVIFAIVYSFANACYGTAS
jgi:hypothetical protein